MDTFVLIPAYNPDEEMLTLLEALSHTDMGLLVVNDGSADAFTYLFRQAEKYALVIGYPENRGKGYALKTGMAYIREKLPHIRYIVTADADGQHLPEDILSVAATLALQGGIVLGTRDLSGKIPLRSRVGNDMSRFVYTISCGRMLGDNQSGLRGFTSSLLPWLESLPGDRYEYEINMLMHATHHRTTITEVPVHTVYSEGNRTSHFRPVPDTVRIQGRMLLSSWADFAGWLAGLLGVILLPLSSPWRVATAGLLGIGLTFFLHMVGAYRRETPTARQLLGFFDRKVFKLLFLLLFSVGMEAAANFPLWASWLLGSVILLPIEYLLQKYLYKRAKKSAIKVS